MNEDSKISSLAEFIARNPVKILITSFLLIFIILFGTTKLVPNFSYRIWFNETSKDLIEFDEFEAKFGSDETTVVVMHSPSGVFDKDSAQTIIDMTDRFWKTKDVIRVDSLSNYNWTHSNGDDIEVEPLIPDDIELTKSLLEERKQIALSNRNVLNYLTSKDAKTAIFYIRLRPFLKSTPNYDEITKSVKQIIDDYRNKFDHSFYFTGSPPLNYSFKNVTQEDMSILIPSVVFVCIIFLLFSLKRLSGVALSLLTIFITIGITMGFGGWIGVQINTVSGMVPQFMIAVSLAVVVHLLVTFYQFYNSGLDKDHALKLAITKNLRPTILTSLSTTFGFFSFATAGIPSIADMGIMAGFGTLLSWLASYFVLIPLVFLIPIKRKSNSANKTNAFIASERSIAFSNWLFRNRKIILLGGTLFSITTILLSLNITINSDPFAYFTRKVQVRQANEFMEENVGGSMGGEFIIQSEKPEGIKEPDFLRKTQELQNWIEQYPFITKTVSIIDILKDTNKSLHGGDDSYYKLPDTKNEIAQQLFLYTMSLPQGMDLNDRMTIRNDALRLTAMWDIHDSKRILQVREDVIKKGEELGLKVNGTGKGILWQTITEPIGMSFLTSVSLALFLISLLLVFGLNSSKIAFLALIPNAMPIIFGGLCSIFLESI
jgi:predicted RND superfamily exporter protein